MTLLHETLLPTGRPVTLPTSRPAPPSFPPFPPAQRPEPPCPERSPFPGALRVYQEKREPLKPGESPDTWASPRSVQDEVLYVVGPGVASWPDGTTPLAAAVADLRAAGYTVFSHQDVWGAFFPVPPLYREVKRACLEVLLQLAERVVLVEGWQDSSFAHVQLKVAQALGLPISDYDTWDATGLWLDMPPFVLYHLFAHSAEQGTSTSALGLS